MGAPRTPLLLTVPEVAAAPTGVAATRADLAAQLTRERAAEHRAECWRLVVAAHQVGATVPQILQHVPVTRASLLRALGDDTHGEGV